MEEYNIDYLFNEIASKTIKKYREQKGMSLEEVVRKMENPISRQSLFKYENNLARMKNNIFIDICQALCIDPNEIFTEINQKTFDATLFNKELPKPFSFPILDEKGFVSYSQVSDDNKYDFDALNKLNEKHLRFDNASVIDIESNKISIPVLGTIKAGVAIEAQQDILEYVDIPKEWTNGNKKFYGLKISGDSMYPKYNENDIVIFEQTEDYTTANNKDCAIMVNGFDATFKNVTINENGITLVPLNLNNQDEYKPTFYNKDQVETLPVKIIGIAREKRTRL